MFTIDDTNPIVAVCTLCSKQIKRGSKKSGPKGYSTSPLHNHAKSCHADDYMEIKEISKQPEPSTSTDVTLTPKEKKMQAIKKQPTITESFEAKKIWDIKDSQAMAIHKKIGLMIALDNHPFTIVEQDGFIELLAHLQPRYLIPSRKYFSDNVIPNIYEEIRAIVMEKLIEAKFISFTSDIWTCSSSKESFISLSGHWIMEDLSNCNAVLHSSHFPGSHTGVNIGNKLQSMWDSWDIKEKSRNILVRDGASNMTLGCDMIKIPSVHCTIHLLQLVVTDCLDSQRYVTDLLTKCRKLTGHFNHSSLACSEFKNLQTDQGLSPLLLVQDVQTRWNSTYLMLERMLKLKRYVQQYLGDHSELLIITSNEWKIMNNLVKLLEPFFRLTKEMSGEYCLLSTVIPNMCTLQLFLSKVSDDDQGVQTMKQELLKSLGKRFFATDEDIALHLQKKKNSKHKPLNILKTREYVLSTAIDPRFKLAFFSNDYKQNVKSWLIEEILQIHETEKQPQEVEKSQLDSSGDESSYSVSSVSTTSSSSSPNKKRKRVDEDLFSACFKEMTKETTKKRIKKSKTGATITVTEIAEEIDRFCNKSLSSRKLSPLEIWKYEEKFPHLKKLVPKLLATPASSVYSERMFSEYGNIFESNRSRLLPQRGEMLLFIHHNARKIKQF